MRTHLAYLFLLFFPQVAKPLRLNQEVLEAIIRLNVFFTTIYVPYCLKVSVGADAMYNDLRLFKSVYDYMDVDGPMAVETL